MPESLLTILKFLFLALVWLFFARVLRAVWAELSPAAEPAPAVGGGRGGVARLKVVEPADKRGLAFDVGDELTVGRAGGCQIALEDDKTVSQLHARVFRGAEGRVYVEDLGSTNGTYLNAKKLTGPAALHRGDRLQVGRTVLEATK
ncbi:MAG TPA: FHA domain-containing protein [Acidimicrobiales bacterium]|nr:FHA domain-containing protein [Acidimicrobiales bacterium]